MITELGRPIHGETPPSGAVPCERTSPLTDAEVAEVAELISRGRLERRPVSLPERVRTRDWDSVVRVLLELDDRLGRRGVGWKVGAASEEIRRAEGLPSPTPGRIYEGTVFPSGSRLDPQLFINFRNCECEFAFELGVDFPAREKPYREADVRAGIESLFPALELGDCVFPDWYGASAYFGSCLDNGGGAALVEGTRMRDWRGIDLARAGIHLHMNDEYIKSGVGSSAMGDPVRSVTWMINWARAHGKEVGAGEVVSSGTCTGHCFAAPGDVVRGDFPELGSVEVRFA